LLYFFIVYKILIFCYTIVNRALCFICTLELMVENLFVDRKNIYRPLLMIIFIKLRKYINKSHNITFNVFLARGHPLKTSGRRGGVCFIYYYLSHIQNEVGPTQSSHTHMQTYKQHIQETQEQAYIHTHTCKHTHTHK